MPDLTPRIGIKKPLGNENVSRASFNENWDIIDSIVATVGVDGKVPADQLPGGLGTRGKITADLNTANLSGFYYVNPSASNAPSANAGSLVVSGGNGFLSQMFTDFTSGIFYIRRQYSDAWQGWKEMATKEYVDAAPTWINLVLSNGLTPFSTGTDPKYTKIGNVVYVEGAVKGLTGASTQVGVLPAGFRPMETVAFAIPTTNNNGANFARWTINAAGQVVMESISAGGSTSNTAWYPTVMTFVATN